MISDMMFAIGDILCILTSRMFLQEQIEETEKFDDAADVAWVNVFVTLLIKKLAKSELLLLSYLHLIPAQLLELYKGSSSKF